MNAAARQINQSTIFNGQIGSIRLSKQFIVHLTLLFLVLVSALAVVYSTNVHREIFTDLQMMEREAQQLQLQWGQLLLERTSLATPGRVQDLAAEKFQMVLPNNNQTVILQLQ